MWCSCLLTQVIEHIQPLAWPGLEGPILEWALVTVLCLTGLELPFVAPDWQLDWLWDVWHDIEFNSIFVWHLAALWLSDWIWLSDCQFQFEFNDGNHAIMHTVICLPKKEQRDQCFGRSCCDPICDLVGQLHRAYVGLSRGKKTNSQTNVRLLRLDFSMSAAILWFVIQWIIGFVLLVQELLCAERSWDSKLGLGRGAENRPQVGGMQGLKKNDVILRPCIVTLDFFPQLDECLERGQDNVWMSSCKDWLFCKTQIPDSSPVGKGAKGHLVGYLISSSYLNLRLQINRHILFLWNKRLDWLMFQ